MIDHLKKKMFDFKPMFLFLASITTSLVSVAAPISLHDKIGQMLLIGFDGKHIDAKSEIVKIIGKDNIGGVILFDYNAQTQIFDKNIESPVQVKKLNQDLQYFTQQANLKYHRPALPLLISVDYEGGKVTRLSEQYGFPVTLTPGEVGKQGPKAAEDNAELMAKTLISSGFNLNFSPLLDVNINPDNPVIAKKDRSFSSDPNTVIQDAEIYSQNFLTKKIQCVYKHFPGHGSSTADSHLGFVDVTDTWRMSELEPYRHLLEQKFSCGMIMSAHIVNRQLDSSGLPATLSHKMLTDLLRHRLHFNGVIITDDMQMKAISDHYGLEQALVLAINAGADMLIFGNTLAAKQDPGQLIQIIEAKVRSGEIKQKRIDEAYQRIITLKKSLAH
jgi:beta-N-acetylhexosaminidase